MTPKIKEKHYFDETILYNEKLKFQDFFVDKGSESRSYLFWDPGYIKRPDLDPQH